MTLAPVVNRLRQEHRHCCLTTNCREKGCFIGLRGFNGSLMVIVHGGRYQKAHRFSDRLSDRIIISSENEGFIGVVELKSGTSSPKLQPVINQIRGGLQVAEQLLDGILIDQWHPILAFSGNVRPEMAAALRAKENLVRFQERGGQVIRRDCNTELAEVVRPDT